MGIAVKPHNGVGQGTLAKVKAALSGEMRRWSSVPPSGSSRSAPLLKSLVRTTAPSFRHKSRTRSSRAIQTDLRLAHSLLMWMFREIRGRRVGGFAEFASDKPCPRGPTKSTCVRRETWIGVHVQSLSKGVLVDCVRRSGAHVEVPRQRTIGIELLIDVPGVVEVTSQRAWVGTPHRTRVPRIVM